jgi:hypothetical protein
VLDKFELNFKTARLLAGVEDKLRREGIEDDEMFEFFTKKMSEYHEQAIFYYNQCKDLIKEVEDYAKRIRERYQQHRKS